MKNILSLFLFVILPWNVAYAADVVKWTEAANYYGENKIVEGDIVTTKCLPKVCFLNFDKNYKTTFTAVIFASDLKKFPVSVDSFYANKKVRVTGIIKEYKGKPEMVISEPSQIEIMGQK